MSDINEVIDLMVANGESEAKIMEVINDYNKSKEQPLPDFADDRDKEVEIKEEPSPVDTTVEGGDTVSSGEQDSSVTPEIDWESPELKGKWNYASDDIGQGIWSREYEAEDEDGSMRMVSEIVSTDNVPKEVLQQWEKESEVKAEIEGGQKGQTAWEFIAGKKDPIITDTPVIENVANFKADVNESEVIKNDINSEIELWKENQIKIKKLNDQIKSTPSVVIPNVGQLPLGPDGKLPEFYNEQAKKEAQEKTRYRQNLLEG